MLMISLVIVIIISGCVTANKPIKENFLEEPFDKEQQDNRLNDELEAIKEIRKRAEKGLEETRELYFDSSVDNIKYTHCVVNVRQERNTSSSIVRKLKVNEGVKVAFLEKNWYSIFDKNEKIKDESKAIGYVYAPLLFSEKMKYGISKSKILRNIESAFTSIYYSPLNNGTPRYLGSSYDEGMTIEIIGNENNVSQATFIYGVTDTYNDITIDHRMLIANRFLKNTVPEMYDTGGWVENKMTDAAGRIQRGYSNFEDTDYFGKKTVTFKFYRSLGVCYVIVSFK